MLFTLKVCCTQFDVFSVWKFKHSGVGKVKCYRTIGGCLVLTQTFTMYVLFCFYKQHLPSSFKLFWMTEVESLSKGIQILDTLER